MRCSASSGSKNSIHSRGKVGANFIDHNARVREIDTLGTCGSACWTWVRTRSTCLLSTRIAVRSRLRSSRARSVLRLAEHIDKRGDLALEGADALVGAALGARRQAKELDCDEILAFATSAVRDAGNSAEVLERVSAEAGVDLIVLSGDEEARLTFLAVRRWLGWSAGRLICMDIGGGSLELAAGSDEAPDVAISLPLGARSADP